MTRSLARLLAVLVVACGLVPLTAGASWACSCAAPILTESQQWRAVALESPVIYVADVVGRSGGDEVGVLGGGQRRYELRVTASLKGGASGTRYVTTNSQGSACGVVLQADRPVLVYGDVLSLCGGGSTQERVRQRVQIIRAALDPGGVHVVQRGEWLWKIARGELARQGHSSRNPAAVRRYVATIYLVNHALIGHNPNRLRVGTRLILPSTRS